MPNGNHLVWSALKAAASAAVSRQKPGWKQANHRCRSANDSCLPIVTPDQAVVRSLVSTPSSRLMSAGGSAWTVSVTWRPWSSVRMTAGSSCPPAPCMGTKPAISVEVLDRWSPSRVKPMVRVTPFIRSGTTSVPSSVSCSSQTGATSQAPTVTSTASTRPPSSGTGYSASARTTVTWSV